MRHPCDMLLATAFLLFYCLDAVIGLAYFITLFMSDWKLSTTS